MATPAEKIKRLRLPELEDPYYTAPKPGSYGGKQGPLTEALREKRARQMAKPETPASSGRPKDSAMTSMENISTGPAASTSEKSFKQAFADARKSGKDGFTWKGKKYTTELAKPKKEEPSADRDLVETHFEEIGYKKGGAVKMAKGGSASSRADGCAQRGKTKGRLV